MPIASTSTSTSFSSTESITHPVAAVLGMSHNPVAYVVNNMSSVIDSSISSEDSSNVSFVSKVSPICAAVAATPLTEVAPLHIPHLYWKCLAGGKVNEFPIIFNALIDHGSSAVLISEQYITKLRLCRKCLLKPYSAELAMESDGHKAIIEFSEYVKVKLHDPSSFWSSKSVRAIIAPGLCAPMILGLPFLVHNNIVVDAAACTVIDKKCNFDLLHPSALPPPPPPKPKLHEFFKQLQEDWKLMVAELNMVCCDRRRHTEFKFEQVKPIDKVATIRERIEVLAAQKELQHLGETLKTEFKDVFSEIPHIDELPTDVYCRIKLKDATKSIQTQNIAKLGAH
jgi:hypothetical protein